MRIELVAKNYQVNEKIDGVIAKKVAKLDKYFEEEIFIGPREEIEQRRQELFEKYLKEAEETRFSL